MKGWRRRMDDWLVRHFSDNVEAQKTIALVASVILAIGFGIFAIAAFLVWRSGVPLHSARHVCIMGEALATVVT